MCGIYGINSICPPDLLKAKLSIMKFRGPDHTGTNYLNNGSNRITLGHNRLAVIDLDARSNQPFEYDGCWIVFNGEIYNYLELKKQLKEKGYNFKTFSDTEVILACYKEFGINSPNYLNGMFSFVIYDSKANLFFGARDRLGKKPFYYRCKNGIFEFASMPSAIVKGDSKIDINTDALGKYLLWGKVQDPDSIFADVWKLPAGCKFTFDLNKKQLSIQKFWDLNTEWLIFNGSFENATKELESLLMDSIKIRLISDVPLGIFLSGGIDSSLIAALARRMENYPIHTFSVKFNEKGFDESKYAKIVSRQLQTKHTEIECSYNDAIQLIFDLDKYFDEPFDDSSAIPSLLLAKYTRKDVTVALSGDGGDESFLGYTRYKLMNQKNYIFNSLPHEIRRTISFFLNKFPGYRWKYLAQGFNAKDINDVYLRHFIGHIIDWHIFQLGNFEYEEFLFNPQKPILERISDFDIKNYLNNDINTKVDRATMAFSLESRSPLMDYRIVEFARSLPTSFKFQKGNQKRILKEILFKYLDPKIFNRPKSGFGMPLGIWFRGTLKEYVYETLREENLIEIPFLKPKVIQKYLKMHMDNRYDFHSILWRLMQLVIWRNNIKKLLG